MSSARTADAVRASRHGWTRIVINWALSRLERADAWLSGTRRAPVTFPVSAPLAVAPAASHVASLVILNWQRPANVRQILDRYVTFAALDDILVWNNNSAEPFHYAHAKVRCVNSDELGLNTRWLGCLAARHACVIVHDDDLVCDEATIDSLVEHHYRDSARTYTLHGRNPTASNEYAEKVDHVAVPTECDVHLTRVTCVNRRWVSHYFDALAAMQLEIDPARGGGEDIVFSYAVRAATGRRPMVVPGRYEDLIARHALANRNGSQAADRTRIMQACQRWLEGVSCRRS
jgi:hypothetical protein